MRLKISSSEKGNHPCPITRSSICSWGAVECALEFEPVNKVKVLVASKETGKSEGKRQREKKIKKEKGKEKLHRMN